jgi:hypothetical protein
MPGQAGETCISSELLARIRSEYRDMPGLCLTPAQAARLWGLAPGVCTQVLEALVAEGALACTRDVRYVTAVHDPGRRSREPRAWAQDRGAA